MARGVLRIYLGAAPGVGKTYRMLEEGRRRAARGTDVVIAVVETHGRTETAKQLGDLELVPRKHVEYRGAAFEELDLQAVLDRAPAVALVDEFAHTNVPGSKNEKRWQDVDVLLDHGIDVISTLNVQHLESLNDVVREITGTVQRETVPDEIVRRAEQVELVDMAAQALRRRMAHGSIYPPEKVDAALSSYFREGNLLSLRELALLWTAGRVDEALQVYRTQHSIKHPWETKERVVVSLDGGPQGDALLRRGARIAERSRGDLLAVHVARSDGLSGGAPAETLVKQEKLTRELGGTYHLVVGDHVSQALIDFARSVEATQLVLGASTRSRLQQLLGGEGVSERITRIAGSIDVHMVGRVDAAKRRRVLPALGPGLGLERRILGLAVGALLLVIITAFLDRIVAPPAIQTTYLLYLSVVLASGLVGGLVSAATIAVSASLVVNWFFTPPVHTFDIARPENLLGLVVFLLVAVVLGLAVEVGTRRAAEATRSAAEAQVLSQLAGSVLQGRTRPAALLQQLREAFGADRVELRRRVAADAPWKQVSVVGRGTRDTDPPGAESAVVDIDEFRQLIVFGPPLAAADRRILSAFASQVGVALDTGQLAEEAANAKALEQSDRVRTALLASVGHDLRTPLAGIKAAVSSLRQDDIAWSPDDEAELLATIEESADRLDLLVRDLLDMTRLQTGAVAPKLRAVWLDEVLGPALIDVPPDVDLVREVPETLPPVLADPVLLERVVANLVGNAVRYGASEGPITVRGEVLGDRLELRVIDRGPGVGVGQRAVMFDPFQRLGDRDESTGIGLGLAVARGFAEALDATLEADDTPGGGLTMLLRLPLAGGQFALDDEDAEAVA
jgi:two-component system sensor histidine kinase KdpD